MPVDSFKYLPRLIALYYQMTEVHPETPIPWTPLPHALADCKIGLVTSGGLYQKGVEPAFDLEKEVNRPTWGDPTYRMIPSDIQQSQIRVSHLHYNPQDVLQDMDILLPVHRIQELVEEHQIGGLAERAYSFMGYQGFPPDSNQWRQVYGPQVAQELLDQEVDCVLLTPA